MSIFKPLYTEIPYNTEDIKIRFITDSDTETDSIEISPEERAKLLADLNEKLSVSEAQSASGDPGISHEDLMNEIRKIINERNL